MISIPAVLVVVAFPTHLAALGGPQTNRLLLPSFTIEDGQLLVTHDTQVRGGLGDTDRDQHGPCKREARDDHKRQIVVE